MFKRSRKQSATERKSRSKATVDAMGSFAGTEGALACELWLSSPNLWVTIATQSPPMKKRRDQIETEKGVLSIHLEPESGAVYLALRPGRVARTRVVQQWPLIAVDEDNRGRELGVEAVGFGAVSIAGVLQQARIPGAKRLAAGAQLAMTPMAKVASA